MEQEKTVEKAKAPKIRPIDTVRDLKHIRAKQWPEEEYIVSGHRACQGCAEVLAVRHVLKALGPDTVAANATGCMEIISSPLPTTAWAIPWIHVAFENAAAVGSGLEAGLKVLMRKGRLPQKEIKAIAMAGDGGTADIGLQALSGALERGHDMIYFCFDNEAYMNTGGQRSGATPIYASTSTQPASTLTMGKIVEKKDLPAIVASHGVEYIATASIAYLKDLQKKVKKAMFYHGSRYIQVDTPCPSVWGFPSDMTLEVGRLGVQSGLVPLFEMEHGKITNVRKIKEKIPVLDYLKTQKRFKHLADHTLAEKEVVRIQKKADANIDKYGLM